MTQRLPLLSALLLSLAPAFSAGATDAGSLTISEPPAIATMPQEASEPVPAAAPQPSSLPANMPFEVKEGPVALPEPPEPSEPVDPEASEAAEKLPEVPKPEDETRPTPNTIILQGLNKVTGHISKLEAPIGTVMRFGNLEIIGRRCWQSPVDEQPENAGLMEIWELKPGESHERIFLGWIFSSSPGLTGLEHPVYDVTMLECAYISPSAHDEKDKENVDKE